jgi:formylglycine-generating enzyme required for sulfatase activity
LFAISNGHLIYDKDAPLGERYMVYPVNKGNHPITGVSWYGAVKYCNWLTIVEGYGEDQRAYAEGTVPTQWRPANLTQAEWEIGFTIAQRLTWLATYSGYRLPLVFGAGPDPFNEFYKAAAWNGTTNTVYGYGRNTIDPGDANYKDSGHPFSAYNVATTPVGFYDGQTHDDFITTSNENYYGIYDLSGNVLEWGTGNGYPAGFPWNGGSWREGRFETCNSVSYHAALWQSICKRNTGSTIAESPSAGFRLVRSAL